jgi:serine/threonine protein kinase
MNVVDIEDLCMGCMEPRGGAMTCPACGYVEGTPAANPIHLPPRTTLKDYYIVGRVLGHGGFGIAYIAWDSNLQIKLAVKEFFPGDFATRGADRSTVAPYSGEAKENFEYGLTKFLDEGRAVARFNDHPGIVPVLNFFRDNGTGYLVMQYVPGMSLKEYLNLKDGRIPFAEAIAITMPVMDTLRAVHEVGLLHRDISPDNIYISTSKRVKLLDFGAARLAMGDRSKSLSVILKAGYAPFEQYQTDVYALAATIYRAITGVVPPEAPSRIAGTDELQPPRALDVEIEPAAEAALLQALAIDPAQRFQTVTDFQHALLETGGRSAGPVSRPGRDQVPQVSDRGTDPQQVAAAIQATPDLQGTGVMTQPRGGSIGPGAGAQGMQAWPGRAPGGGGQGAAGAGAAAGANALPSQAANALTSLIDLIDQPIAAVSTLIQQQFGIGPAPEDQAAVSRRGVLIGAAVIGGVGVMWTLSMMMTFAGVLSIALNTPLLVGLVRAMIGCAGAGLMVAGALAGLMGDRRGTTIVWGVGCLLVIAGIGGGLLQVLTYIPTASAGIIWFSLTNEIWTTLQALLPTIVILLLLWLRTSVRGTAAA